MAELLDAAGYRETAEPEKSDLIIVNTCGFIQPAREESLARFEGIRRSKE